MKNIRKRIELLALKVGILAQWGLGNPALKPSVKARKARAKAASLYGSNWYAPLEGLPVAHTAVALWYASQGVTLKLDRDNVSKNIGITTLGTRVLLRYRLEALRKKIGRTPTVFGPAELYGGHTDACKAAGAKYVKVHRHHSASFIQACANLLEAGCPCDMIIASTVYNPTGEVMTQKDQRLAVRFVRKYKIALMVDGAYKQLYYDRPLGSIFSIRGAMKLDIFETDSASKGPQWPDLKTGDFVGRPSVVSAINAEMGNDIDGGSGTNQIAYAACLDDRANLADTRLYYWNMLQFVVEVLNKAGWHEVVMCKAGMFLWAEIPQLLHDLGWNSEDFALALAKLGVIVYPDTMFGGNGTKVRMCPKGSRASIRKVGTLIHKIIEHYKR